MFPSIIKTPQNFLRNFINNKIKDVLTSETKMEAKTGEGELEVGNVHTEFAPLQIEIIIFLLNFY